MFQRNPASFYMMHMENLAYRVNIKKAEMRRQVQVRDEVVEVHNKPVMNPAKGSFNCPIARGKIISHTVTQGPLEYTFNLPESDSPPRGAGLRERNGECWN